MGGISNLTHIDSQVLAPVSAPITPSGYAPLVNVTVRPLQSAQTIGTYPVGTENVNETRFSLGKSISYYTSLGFTLAQAQELSSGSIPTSFDRFQRARVITAVDTSVGYNPQTQGPQVLPPTANLVTPGIIIVLVLIVVAYFIWK